MSPRISAVIAAAAVSISLVSVSGQADAATYYSSCANLTHIWPHGVAKSAAAAQRQVNQGYGRPASGPRARAVYWENYKRLDRDRDGTACER
ncbi:MAG TPA: excalibur calcium-binding domain-containing protein [Nocardioides sp.]|nr:excalibur calcium-binding domain-containing protein [Nocardioides sp.]